MALIQFPCCSRESVVDYNKNKLVPLKLIVFPDDRYCIRDRRNTENVVHFQSQRVGADPHESKNLFT